MWQKMLPSRDLVEVTSNNPIQRALDAKHVSRVTKTISSITDTQVGKFGNGQRYILGNILDFLSNYNVSLMDMPKIRGFLHFRGAIIWGSNFHRHVLLFSLDNKFLGAIIVLLHFLYSSQHPRRCLAQWPSINTSWMNVREEVTTQK